MQPLRINITQALTEAELFFVQKSVELLYKDTLDTYRLRLNNPKAILLEIRQILPLIETKALKDVYAKMLFEEARDLVKDEKELVFNSIQKGYLLSILSGNDFNSAFYAINIVLKENNNYLQILYDKINAEIQRLNVLGNFNPAEYYLLNRLISYFIVELKSRGYSKEYLHRFIRSIFSLSTPLADFTAAYTAIGTLITKPEERYTVYIGFKVLGGIQGQVITSMEIVKINYQDLKQEAAAINPFFERHVKKYSYLEFYKIKVSCQDYFHAGYIARQKLQHSLDILFMGHSGIEIELHRYCFIVGENNPAKGNRHLLKYQLDGQFASDQAHYQAFLQKMDDLEQKPLDEISKAKLLSGLRYLRLGTIADELENKLLNYWIAIEYLFSSNEGEQDKVKRLKDYFKKIHSISYLTRIFSYVHKSIAQLGIQAQISNYHATNLEYLANPQTLVDLQAIANLHPLLVYRVYVLTNQRFKDVPSIKEELKRHQNNLERNLMRIYRLRNEIVHNAAREKNIQDVTAHLRYYLTFIINGFIEFSLNNPIDVNKDGKISLDDYFTIMCMQLDSMLLDDQLDITKLLKFSNPIEYLS